MTCEIHTLKLKTLGAISGVIDRALQLEEALADILCVLAETLSMQRATITLLDQDTGQLVIAASHGLTREERERGVYRLDEGVTGTIFRTGRPYLVHDVRKDPLFLDRTGARRVEKVKISFLGVPILKQGNPLGVLNVDRLFSDDISCIEDLEFLQVVATLVAQFLSLNEQVAARENSLKRENMQLRTRVLDSRGDYIVGRSSAMMEVQRYIQRVAGTRATVLLLGESGVGKTLIARLVHTLSERKPHPFIKVNCASIPETLLEAELFGHERGAFTGAISSRVGRFEEAQKGTIFLDEIGELPSGIQAKLLRVLQDREFERLGSNQTRKADVRIVTATNRDLAAQVEAGAFRQDLYYRLCVFPIRVPPLRERREDIPSLLNHFLAKISRDYGRSLTLAPDALALLQGHDWPGNVREMENLIERMAILTDGGVVVRRFLEPMLENSSRDEATLMEAHLGSRPSLLEVERAELLAALRRNAWVQHKAAHDLGISPRQMGYRLRKWGLSELVTVERARNR